jgi:ArsR family transcriptional regulator
MPKRTQSMDCPKEARRTLEPAERHVETSVDTMFRAFSDRTRLRILRLLLDGEMCVGDLVSILETDQPRVSQHLAYLRSAGLVVGRKQGLWSFYSLAVPKSPFHLKLLDCLGHCFAEVPELKADQQRAAEIARRGGCCTSDSGIRATSSPVG